jgi:sugar transferase (PEP-CTERM system associated)
MECTRRIILLVVSDVVSALLAIPAACLILYGTASAAGALADLGIVRVLAFPLGLIFMSFIAEIYAQHHALSVRELTARIALSLGFILMIAAAAGFVSPALIIGRGLLTISLVVFGVLQLLAHAGYRIVVKLRGLARKVIILGTGRLAGDMGAIISTSDANYILSGYVKCSEEEAAKVPSGTILGDTADLYLMAKREKADKIVVSLSERRGAFPLRDVMACKLDGIEVVDAPSFYEKVTGKLLLENITPSWFIYSEGFRISAARRIMKRMVDIACSMVGLALTLPLFPLIALAIKLDSAGPVFFRQERVGERERTFTLYKFRTMGTDAEKGTGAVWAQANDPRVTRLGKFFRKSRIDELPQFFNMLMGDMSMVGPRPERPEFVQKLKDLIPYYSERHFVKPGVTGWAQVRYPYGASVEDTIEKLRYDLYYIKNISLVFDSLIILETIKVVLFRRGAR